MNRALLVPMAEWAATATVNCHWHSKKKPRAQKLGRGAISCNQGIVSMVPPVVPLIRWHPGYPGGTPYP